MAVCFVDLDGIKKMNDQYGHAEGDRYFRTVTGQLRHACRSKKDLLFRYGGDEFRLLFLESPVNIIENRMEEILRMLAEQGRTESFSYGIIDGRQFSDMEELIQAADQLTRIRFRTIMQSVRNRIHKGRKEILNGNIKKANG